MKPKKRDMHECDNCHNQEYVAVDAKAKIMNLKCGGTEYEWCPDCVYQIVPWRKHVNEDHLTKPLQAMEILNPGDEDIFIVPSSAKKALK